MLDNEYEQEIENDIAIIAMAGHFPDAEDLDTFWQNLRNGVESVRTVTNQELCDRGFGDFLKENPNFRCAEADLDRERMKEFDAAFFAMSPREAEIMDPQQRMFLEMCWELFERAGYSTEHYDGRVGVFGSTAFSGYLESHLLPNRELLEEVGSFQTTLGNDKDFLATRVSYKMGFTGPSINVSTLCSSAAVGIHLARESLLSYQIDMAIAGAANLNISTSATTYYQEGGIGADDGHCRAYDERASGTVSGAGLGGIVMKRLADALEDGDTIAAVIKGTAINNDGSNKASYTAPSPEGQAEVIAEAIAISNVDPETISLIDGHGTATNIGDPIEVTALTKAYRQYTDKKQFCGLGSVKTNIGHLVTAGGVASLIKAVLSLQHKEMPPSLNFETPNAKIDFANSPFYVNNTLKPWEAAEDHPRRAAVSSFGIGGTNVHTILEEAPEVTPTVGSSGTQLVMLSAKSANALTNMKANLLAHIENNPELNLTDISYTLKVGRCSFEHRFVALCNDLEELKAQLSPETATQVVTSRQKSIERSVCFMFSGQGSQYQQMAKALYQSEAVFKAAVDECATILEQSHNIDLLAMLYPDQVADTCPLKDTQYAQLSLFVTEYALVQLWQRWDINPDSMIGHSLGEYVAACISGVFSLNDALAIVVKRGQLMAAAPAGKMIAVNMSEEQVAPYLNESVNLAAVNSQSSVVLAGDVDTIGALGSELTSIGAGVTELHTSHAFHSYMMDEVLAPFKQVFEAVTLNKPEIPFVSNLTGTWITDEQAMDPAYWADHLRNAVRFSDGIATIAEDESSVYLEVGPGKTLATLAKMTLADTQHDTRLVMTSLPSFKARGSEDSTMAMALANFWSLGGQPNWNKYYGDLQPKRLPLPTYAFERKKFWVEPKTLLHRGSQIDVELSDSEELSSNEIANSTFTSGNIQINFTLDQTAQGDGVSQQQQLQALLALKEEFEAKCQALTQSTHLGLEVSSVGLTKSIEQSQDHEQTLDELANNEPVSEYTNPRPNIDTAYAAPETELEKQLATYWSTALGYSPVGIHDNFFDVGGHSLVAASLVNQLRKTYDLNLELIELLEIPTVHQIANLIETKTWLAQEQQPEVASDDEGEALLL